MVQNKYHCLGELPYCSLGSIPMQEPNSRLAESSPLHLEARRPPHLPFFTGGRNTPVYIFNSCVSWRSSRSCEPEDFDPKSHILLVHPRGPSRARVNSPNQWPRGPTTLVMLAYLEFCKKTDPGCSDFPDMLPVCRCLDRVGG